LIVAASAFKLLSSISRGLPPEYLLPVSAVLSWHSQSDKLTATSTTVALFF